MTEEKKGKIALSIMKHKIREDGIRLRPGFNRELAKMAKVIGIPYEEAVEFFTELSREAFEQHIASLAKPPAPQAKAESKENFEYD